MKLSEAAKKGITRLAYVQDGKPVWNKYSFGDIHVYSDGTMGPWMNVYDPCGSLACGNPAWTAIPIITIPITTQPSVGKDDEFEVFIPPDDMDRFPGCPPIPSVVQVPPRASVTAASTPNSEQPAALPPSQAGGIR